MRFKRPGVRYSDTPEPETAYQRAGQVWDERLGASRAQARNWRLMAFGSLGLSVLMGSGLLWQPATPRSRPMWSRSTSRATCAPSARRLKATSQTTRRSPTI